MPLGQNRGVNRRSSSIFGKLGPFEAIAYQRTPPDHDFLHAITVSTRLPERDDSILAAGGGLTWKRAVTAAIGEAIERHALSNNNSIQRYLAPEGPKLGNHVTPSNLLHFPNETYTQAGIPLKEYHHGEEIFWVQGYDLSTHENILIPAFAIFASAQHPLGNIYDLPVSTGAACGRNLHEATLSGLYEVIERDAFMLHWENRRATQAPPSLNSVNGLKDILKKRGFNLRVGQLFSDTGVPVALAAVEDFLSGRAATAFGAAARANWDDACFRAAEEAVLTSFWISSLRKTEQSSLESVIDEMNFVPTPARHAFLYGFPEMRENSAFLWKLSSDVKASSNVQIEFDSSRSELAWLRDRISARPVVVDLTDDLARSCDCTVVKVVVPGFIPLGLGKYVRPLKNKRLKDIPQDLGWFDSTQEFNSAPHPFP